MTSAGHTQHFPRGLRRSHTTEKGFRHIDLQEHGYTFERPTKNDALKEAVQSPYLNGRKNNNYKNPTFHSSFTLNQSVEIQRSRTPEAQTLRRASIASQSTSNLRVLSSITPREPLEVNRKLDFAVETVAPVETEKKSSIQQAPQTPVEKQVERHVKIEEDFTSNECLMFIF